MFKTCNQEFNSRHYDWIRLSKTDNCPAEVFLALSKESASNAHYLLKRGLANKNQNPNTLRKLYKSGNKEIIQYMLANSYLPQDLIEEVINSNNGTHLYYLSVNPYLSDETIFKIYEKAIELKDFIIIFNYIHQNSIDIKLILRDLSRIKEKLGLKEYNEIIREICEKNYIIDGVSNKKFDSNLLRELYYYGNDNIISLILVENKLPKDIIDGVINSNDNNRIYYLSKNKSLSIEDYKRIYEKAFEIKDISIIKSLIYSNIINYKIALNDLDRIKECFKKDVCEIFIKGLTNYILKEKINEIYNIISLYNKHDDLMIEIINNDNVTSEILEHICFNYGKEELYLEMAYRKINRKTFEKLLSTKNVDIYYRLIVNKECTIDDIINMCEIFKNNSSFIKESIYRLDKRFDESHHITSEQFVKLVSLGNKEIYELLANKCNYLKYNEVLYLYNLGQEEILAKECEKVYVLFIIGYNTKNYDVFADIVERLKDNPGYMFALERRRMAKDLLTLRHPRAKEVNDTFNEWGRPKDRIFKNTETNKRIVNSLIKIFCSDCFVSAKEYVKSNTSLIQVTDEINISKGIITIKPEDFDIIIRNMQKHNHSVIVYGSYPMSECSVEIRTALNNLFDIKKLSTTGKKHRMLDNSGNVCNLDEYEFNGRKFVRMVESGISKWYEVMPMAWKVNKDNKTLELRNILPNINSNSKDFLNKEFKSDILEPYNITNEEKEYKKELEKEKEKRLSKFKVEDAKKEEEKQKKVLEETYKEAVAYIGELTKLLSKLGTDQVHSMVKLDKLYHSIRVPDDVLIIKVDNHYEFNPEFIPILRFIDLSFVETKNLKLSGLDLRETNIHFDPQEIYKKDLSYSLLSDDNVSWKSFKGVILIGSSIEEETDSFEIDEAIIDNNTKLPKNNRKRKTSII